MHYLKHYPFTWLIFIAVMVLSLMPVPEMPILEFRLADKWTHILMYFGQAGAVWLDYMRLHGLRFTPWPKGPSADALDRKRLCIGAFWCPFLMGGIVELLQAYCTGGTRSGDWFDWLADAIGVVAAWYVCKFYLRLQQGRGE